MVKISWRLIDRAETVMGRVNVVCVTGLRILAAIRIREARMDEI